MKLPSLKLNPLTKIMLAAAAITTLTACSSVPYRCPLDSAEEPDSKTACVGMEEALDAAKRGGGGKHSVIVDDKGNIIPPELAHKKTLKVINQATEPYVEASGSPQYRQPKVFQVWTPAYVDSDGVLHDGRNSYFTTPGEWRYGTLNGSGTKGSEVAEGLFRPSKETDLPKGRILTPDELKAKTAVVKAQASTEAVKDTPSDKVALTNLSQSAQKAATKNAVNVQAAPGVTSPSVQITD